MVLDALRRTELRGCRRSSRHAQRALAMIRVSGATPNSTETPCKRAPTHVRLYQAPRLSLQIALIQQQYLGH